MRCPRCEHPAAWHHREDGCMWLAMAGRKGCPCPLTPDEIRGLRERGIWSRARGWDK